MPTAPISHRKPIVPRLPTAAEVSRVLGGAFAGALAGMVLACLAYGSLVVGLFAAMAGAATGMVIATGERERQAD